MSFKIGMNRLGLKIKAKAPELLIGAGIVTGIAAGVTACIATTKLNTVTKELEANLEAIEEGRANQEAILEAKPDAEEIYSEKDATKDTAIVYGKAALGYLKLYAPAITLGAVSVTCILTGFGMLKKKHLAVVASYKALEESYTRYRAKVVEKYGEAKDAEIRRESVEEALKEAKEAGYENNPAFNGYSQHAKFFDETAGQWTEDAEYNMQYLLIQQSIANDKLRARGHLFLNEVYDMLGLDRTQAGAVVGWVLGNGDDFIDFGIHTIKNGDFVNGYNTSILLDFNVDGLIQDLI